MTTDKNTVCLNTNQEMMIDGKHLTFRYENPGIKAEKYAALGDVNFFAESGSFIAVLGENGCGKTTLAKQFNVLLPHQEGSLKISGLDVSDPENLWEIRRKCGMVFQNPDNQFVSSVVNEDVAFGLENYNVPRGEIQTRVKNALQTVAMQNFEFSSPQKLSGGQKQRIAIAGILAVEPDLIIFDESTSMLDMKCRGEVMKTILALHKSGHRTIILITHYLDEAAFADRVVLMKAGKIFAEGIPQKILTDPVLLQEAGLIPEFPVRICKEMEKSGIKFGKCPLTIEEAADQITALFENRALPLQKSSKVLSKCRISSTNAKINSSILLDVKDVSFTYGSGTSLEQVALDHVNFTVHSGEFIGIAGQTGCGKSTLLQIIAGLIQPTSGKVLIGGKPARTAEKNSAGRFITGIVFQYPEQQLFEQSVEKDVGFSLKNSGLSDFEIKKQVKAAIELVGLDYEKIREISPLSFSGGEKRRIAIAGILAMKPEMLLLDEPCAGIDPAFHKKLMELFKKLNDAGTTILMISHNMDDFAEYVDRLLVIDKGQLVLDGTPEKVFENVEKMDELHLGVSSTKRLVSLLEGKGIPVSRKIFSEDQLIRELKMLFLSEKFTSAEAAR